MINKTKVINFDEDTIWDTHPDFLRLNVDVVRYQVFGLQK